MKNLIESWHSLLNMPKHDLAWHTEDIADEFEEFKEARGFIDKWSELSDVAYTYTRAQWSGHKNVEFPFKIIIFYKDNFQKDIFIFSFLEYILYLYKD